VRRGRPDRPTARELEGLEIQPDSVSDITDVEVAVVGRVGRRSIWPSTWSIARYVLGLAALGVALWAISGKTGELEGATNYLTHIHWAWVALAIGAEIVSYVAMASVQRRLLAAGDVRTGMVAMTGLSIGGAAIQYSLPAGTLFCFAWAFRQYRRRGADDLLAGWTILAFNMVMFVTLALLALAGLGLASSSGNAFDLAEVTIGIGVLAALLLVAWLKRERMIGPFTSAVRICQRVVRHPTPEVPAGEVVTTWLDHAKAVNPSRREWARIFAMGGSMWVADLACLAIAFAAVGAGVPWQGLLLAYGAGQLASNLPITPGGLGVVEGSITVALVTFGGGGASTVAAVLLYRVISFWLVLPAGWAAVAGFAWTGRRRTVQAASPVGGHPGQETSS
jgi:putative heme transporter